MFKHDCIAHFTADECAGIVRAAERLANVNMDELPQSVLSAIADLDEAVFPIRAAVREAKAEAV